MVASVQQAANQAKTVHAEGITANVNQESAQPAGQQIAIHLAEITQSNGVVIPRQRFDEPSMGGDFSRLKKFDVTS